MCNKKMLAGLSIIIITIILLVGGIFLSKKVNDKNINNDEIKKSTNFDIENNTDKDNDNSLEEGNINNITDVDNKNNNNQSNGGNNENKESSTTTTDSKTTSPTDENSKKDIPSSLKLYTLGSLQYYLYIPSNPTTNMPLIMYLHGGTNKKANVEALLTTDGFPKYLNDGYYNNLRAYVVIPKLNSNYTGWVDIADSLRNLIKTIKEIYNIDMNKVSLTGHSMGGTGTYQLQTKLSNTFACIAPMSGSIKNTEENINALSKTKVWAFIGSADTIVKPDSTRTIIAAIKEKGANAKITEIEGATHFEVPAAGYKNSDVINWLVNCSK